MASTPPATELPTDGIEGFQGELLEAGFSNVEVLDAENVFFRFYHLEP